MTSTSYRWSDYRDAIDKASIHVIVDGKAIARYQRDPDTEGRLERLVLQCGILRNGCACN